MARFTHFARHKIPAPRHFQLFCTPAHGTHQTYQTYILVCSSSIISSSIGRHELSMSITSITILQRHHQQHYQHGHQHCQHHHPTHLPAQPIQRILHYVLLKAVPVFLGCIALVCSSGIISSIIGTGISIISVPNHHPPHLPAQPVQGEEALEADLVGLTQHQMSSKADLPQQRQLIGGIEEEDVREVARISSLSLPHAGDWLNTPPLTALGLHLRSSEFVLAVKYRLGLPVYDRAGPCPACLRPSDAMGDHAMCCGSGGERISRHNALRDAIFDTAASAGLAPVKEGRFLLPGDDRRPADVLVPHWAGGRDVALDVTVVHPIQAATMPNAATTPGFALTFAHDRKIRGAQDDCQRQGIAFIPMVAESFGGWHTAAEREVKKLGAALARHTGQDEGQATGHLWGRLGILLQRGNAALLANRVPGHPDAVIDGLI